MPSRLVIKLAYFGLQAAYLLGLLDPAKCIEELCLAIDLIKLISILKDGVSLDFLQYYRMPELRLILKDSRVREIEGYALSNFKTSIGLCFSCNMLQLDVQESVSDVCFQTMRSNRSECLAEAAWWRTPPLSSWTRCQWQWQRRWRKRIQRPREWKLPIMRLVSIKIDDFIL